MQLGNRPVPTSFVSDMDCFPVDSEGRLIVPEQELSGSPRSSRAPDTLADCSESFGRMVRSEVERLIRESTRYRCANRWLFDGAYNLANGTSLNRFLGGFSGEFKGLRVSIYQSTGSIEFCAPGDMYVQIRLAGETLHFYIKRNDEVNWARTGVDEAQLQSDKRLLAGNDDPVTLLKHLLQEWICR